MILCCGEALIDMIQTPLPDGRPAFSPHPGGALFNTAIGLGRLDAPVGLLSGVSTDMFGGMLVDALRASGVDTTHLIRSARPTTLAFVVLTEGKADYQFYDENSAGRMIQAPDVSRIGGDVSACLFGGISLCAEPGADVLADLAVQQEKDRVVMLDPNIRAGFVEDEGRYRARLWRIFGRAEIVKVSDEDLEWLVPDAGSLENGAQALIDLGVGLVLVTCGSEGSQAFTASGLRLQVPAVPAQVVDTVGAGDSYNAGFLAALSEADLLSPDALATIGEPNLRRAMGFAARVAAVTVSRAGANPPHRADIT